MKEQTLFHDFKLVPKSIQAMMALPDNTVTVLPTHLPLPGALCCSKSKVLCRTSQH